MYFTHSILNNTYCVRHNQQSIHHDPNYQDCTKISMGVIHHHNKTENYKIEHYIIEWF